MATLYYHGCLGQPGHYLYRPPGISSSRRKLTPFGWELDGGYAPKGRQVEGRARLVHDKGWTILAFWDRTGDTRGNSNSAFLIEGEHTFDEMVAMAQEHYPKVWKRITAKFEVTQHAG